MKVTIAKIRNTLRYNPKTGVFIRRVSSRANKANAGDIAGGKNNQGYIQIRVGGLLMKAHRLAWVLFFGEWPNKDIDHIDGNRSNNKISNLRLSSRAMNGQNRKRPNKNNSSAFLGARKHGSKWQAKIFANGRDVHLGTFDTPRAAHVAYVKAKRSLHKGCTI